MRCSKLAGGITGLRDMGSPLEDILQLREETDDGTTLGPHLVVAGPIVQGPLPFKMPQFISVKDPTEARQTVDMLRTRGVDFIEGAGRDTTRHLRGSSRRSSPRAHELRHTSPVGSYTFARMAFLICLILASSRL